MLEYYDKRDYRLSLFVIVGLLFAGIGLAIGWGSVKAVREGVRAEGTVVDTSTSRGDHGTMYAPVVSFPDASGTKHQFTSKISSGRNDYALGSHVKVIYPPAKPDAASIDSFTTLWLFPVSFSLMGLLCAVIGLASIIGSGRFRKLAAKLRQNGLKVNAEVVAIRNGTTSINRQYSQIVDARAADGTVYETPELRPDYAVGFMVGGIADVYVSPEDPKAYLVDVPPKGSSIARPSAAAGMRPQQTAWDATPPQPNSLPTDRPQR